jgi:hypothetical protein
MLWIVLKWVNNPRWSCFAHVNRMIAMRRNSAVVPRTTVGSALVWQWNHLTMSINIRNSASRRHMYYIIT